MGGLKARAKKQKQQRDARKKQRLQNQQDNLPFVSVCTPTFNRRPFIPYIIKIFQQQTYPMDRMEWIVVDDGTDPVGDLFDGIPQVKYIRVEEKMSLGKKRNFMHDHAKGDILVYMDDDDYYPPDRVEHAVDMLRQNPQAMACGSSKIYIYFKHNKTMYTFGPYGPNHATAGTFAFRKELLKTSRYEDEAAIAEEKAFLKNYTVPFVQLDPRKTILVFSHDHNTFDKRRLLDNPNPQIVKPTMVKVRDFIKDSEIRNFFMTDIEAKLGAYEAGRPDMKPDVLRQIKEIDEKRKQQQEEASKEYGKGGQITVTGPDGKPRALTITEVANMLKQQQAGLQQAGQRIQQLMQQVKALEIELEKEREKNISTTTENTETSSDTTTETGVTQNVVEEIVL